MDILKNNLNVPAGIKKITDNDADEIIREYFDKDEWLALPDVEKLRNRLIFMNHVSNPEQAHLMPIPPFLNNPKGELLLKKLAELGGIKTKTRRGKRKTIAKDNAEVKAPTKKSRNVSEKARQNPERNSKTKVVTYQEEEIPEDDRYIFCDKCQKDVVDYCDTCGMLVVVQDIPVPVGVPDRARKTVPSIFEIRESTVHGLGVFVKLKLPQGIQVGPYEGTVTRISNTNGYSWKLRNNKLVDAANETVSNWMRYVNCAPHISAQNLVAFQYKGELFYRTARSIQKGEELLVYYGNSFARELGIEPKKYFDPQIENQLKPYFTCKHCNIGLTLEKFRDAHEMRCHIRREVYYTGETFACTHCDIWYSSKEDRDSHQMRCRKNSDKIQKRINETKSSCEDFKVNHTCRQCDYQTNLRGSYNRHMLIHDKENAPKYICAKCSYITIHKRNLKIHLKTHSDGASSLICKCCSKSFNQKKSLDYHYICKHPDRMDMWKSTITCKFSECPKYLDNSVYSGNLSYFKSHATDQKQKKYHCGVCGYQCIQKSNFTAHLRIHVGLQPFVCIECNKKYNLKSQLSGHILSKHSDNERLIKSVTSKVHFCTNCNFRTVLSSHLKRHFKSCKNK